MKLEGEGDENVSAFESKVDKMENELLKLNQELDRLIRTKNYDFVEAVSEKIDKLERKLNQFRSFHENRSESSVWSF